MIFSWLELIICILFTDVCQSLLHLISLFDGVSVLAVCDLSQLPPVARRPVFDTVSDFIASMYGSLWKKNSRVLELHQIMRQKDDVDFVEALNRIRLSKHTDNDIQLIKTRETDVSSPTYPKQALHIFPFKKMLMVVTTKC